MPIFANPNFLINLPTLCAVTAFITVISGALMLFSWLQNRSEPALALWGVGYLLGTVGGAFLVRSSPDVPTWSVCVGNALLCCAYGTMWAGARSFEGRRPRLSLVLAGAAIWVVACQFPEFYQSVEARVALACTIFAAYSLLCAREMWYPRDRELVSRWPTLALAVIHAGFLLTRIHYVGAFQSMSAAHPVQSVGLVCAGVRDAVRCVLPGLPAHGHGEGARRARAAARGVDRSADRNRQPARVLRLGSPLLETHARRPPRGGAACCSTSTASRRSTTRPGHQAGDEVLKAFARLVAESIQPGDLFARLGGEEFACLLIDAPMAEALRIAERVRGKFEAMRFAGLQADTTVSVGVAMAGDTGRDLSSLLATADRALYRAKAEGRNRVAPAPLVLVERGGDTRHVALGGVIPAPLAG